MLLSKHNQHHLHHSDPIFFSYSHLKAYWLSFDQHKLHCIRLIHCNNTNSETILSEIKVFYVKSFNFQLIKKHFRFLQLLCQRVKCMRLKKSDLFRILLLVALELSLHLFCSDLSHFFQKPRHNHFFFGQKKI